MVSIMVIGRVKFVVMVEVMIMIMIMVIFMVINFVIVINIFFVMVKIIVISMVIMIVLVMIMVIYYDPPPSYHINPFKPHSALPSGNLTPLSSRTQALSRGRNLNSLCINSLVRLPFKNFSGVKFCALP